MGSRTTVRSWWCRITTSGIGSTGFFSRVRSRLRADDGTLVDAAGGHGLVGALAAIFKFEQFQRIEVRDLKRPKSFSAVVDAAVEVTESGAEVAS